MRPLYIASTKLASAFLILVFVLQLYQAAVQPIRTSEAYLYDRFVRPTLRQTWSSELPDRDSLYALLEKRTVGLFHVSPWSVRLPALFAAILYFWSLERLARLLSKSPRIYFITIVLGALAPLQWDCFSRADGAGLALALITCAGALAVRYLKASQPVDLLYLNLAGAGLGLAVAARIEFLLPSALAVLLLGIILARRRQLSVWIDHVFLPCVLAAFILLVLPLSHSHAASQSAPELGPAVADELQTALYLLANHAGQGPVLIAAFPSAEPVVNFYRAEHRLTQWARATRDTWSADYDFYLLPASQEASLPDRHLIVIVRYGDFLLARRERA